MVMTSIVHNDDFRSRHAIRSRKSSSSSSVVIGGAAIILLGVFIGAKKRDKRRGDERPRPD